MTTTTTEFEDITKDFEAAARDMITGEYLSDGQTFSLNSAMYATDSGDPQLDPAYGCTKILIGHEHLAGATPSIPLPDMRLDPLLVIGAMDRALSAFSAWNTGLGSGLHTMYSCVYFQLPESAITSAWLGPFVQGVVCIHDFLMPHIRLSSIVKSEDVCTLDTKQFNDRDLANKGLTQKELHDKNAILASPEHANKVLKALDDALALLPSITEAENENADANTSKVKRAFYGTAEKDVEEKVPEEKRMQVAEAIAARLLLVRQLLEIHVALDACNVPNARKAAQLCVDKVLPKIAGTLALGAEEPKGTFNAESWRRARSAIYVRRFKFPSVEEALQVFREQLEDILEICGLASLEVCDYVSLYHWVKNFMHAQRERNVFARIWLSHLLKLTGKWLRRSSAVLTTGSFNIIPVPRLIVDNDNAMDIEAKISIEWGATLDALLMNRARLFRKLPSVFMRWDDLQSEAMGADRALLKVFPMDAPELAGNVRKGLFFFTYIVHVKLMLMVEYLTCGLALDIYLEHEYRYVLWYSEYIMSIVQSCSQDILAQYNVFNKLYSKKAKQTKTDKKWALEQPKFPYGNKETTYQYRFKDIFKVTVPSPIEYKKFHESSNFRKYKSEMLYKVATEDFVSAKEIIQACNKKITSPAKAPLFFVHDHVMKWLRLIAMNLINAKVIPDALTKNPAEYKKTNKIHFRYNVYPFLPVVVAEKVVPATAEESQKEKETDKKKESN